MSTNATGTAEAGDQATEAATRAAAAVEGKPKGRHFSMSVVNFWLDAFLLALLTLYGWVTAMMRIVFPAPSDAKGWTLWGWQFDQWWDFQFNVLCAFALGILVHVMLHWNWVCSVVASQILRARRPDDSMQTIYGVGTLIVLLHVIVIGVIAAMYSVHKPH